MAARKRRDSEQMKKDMVNLRSKINNGELDTVQKIEEVYEFFVEEQEENKKLFNALIRAQQMIDTYQKMHEETQKQMNAVIIKMMNQKKRIEELLGIEIKYKESMQSNLILKEQLKKALKQNEELKQLKTSGNINNKNMMEKQDWNQNKR